MSDNEMLKLILDKVTYLESDIQEIKQRVTKIDLTLENEIRVNI